MIERRTPLKRTAVRKRRPGPPRRGPSDIPPEMWRNPGYLKFLREEGRCTVCMIAVRKAQMEPFLAIQRPCDPAHGLTNGASSKGPDAEAIPLCRPHHDEQHAIGWTKFEAKYGFSREAEAAVWWTAFQIWKEHNNG